MCAAIFDFLPESYSLPSERRELLEAMKKEPDSLWIVKPSNQCCGNGINVIKRFIGKWVDFNSSIVTQKDNRSSKQIQQGTLLRSKIFKAWNLREVSRNKNPNTSKKTETESKQLKPLKQFQLRNPLLINNRKFDLRLYVLLTSIDPIRYH